VAHAAIVILLPLVFGVEICQLFGVLLGLGSGNHTRPNLQGINDDTGENHRARLFLD